MTDPQTSDVRVHRNGRGGDAAPGVNLEVVPPDAPGSPLSSAHLELAAKASWHLEAGADDVLVYTVCGQGRLDDIRLAAGTAVRLGRGEAGSVEAGGEPLQLIVFRCGPGCDEHAPLGEPVRAARVDLGSLDAATSGREFQVLFDMYNGSGRATLFLGKVPPGAAPWHFHQYDEIVWILDGHGLYHLAGGEEEFESGSAFRVRPREVHVVENASSEPMLLLGVFTPAGSPAAAFLAGDPRG
ncbi:MAG: cupin domain-containing protein [Candidatus Dormibacteraeota bacterium]|nr:cupin domain-containing protein [Candidatus Dormibacteraeota bacterium]